MQRIQPCPPGLVSHRDLAVEAVAKGRFIRASEIFQQGYDESRRLANTACAIRFLTNLGNTRFKMFRYRHAMEAYLEARRLAREIRDDEMAALVSANIAWLYLYMGAIPEAMEAADEMQAGYRDLSSSIHSPRILALQGMLYARQGEWGRASRLLTQALEEDDRRSDLDTTIRTLDEWGLTLLGAARFAEAEAVLTEAFRIARLNGRPIPDHRYRNLAMLRLAHGDLRSARRLMEEGFRAARTFGSSVPAWSLYYRRAQIRLAAGQLEEALADLQVAVNSIRDLREDLLPADAIRWKTGASVDQVFQSYVEAANRLFSRTGQADLARSSFEVVERQRAAALREALGESREVGTRLPAEYLEILGRIRSSESALWTREQSEVRRQLERWRHRLTEIELEMALKAPLVLPTPQSVSVAGLQRMLRPSEALLSFRLGESCSYLWSITQESFSLHELPGRTQLEGRVAAFRQAVRESGPAVASLGRELHALLFNSLDPAAAAKPDWILLPDGKLFELPFPALVTRSSGNRPVFLVEEHSLRILPAAAMLGLPREPAWRGPFLAVGDPVYNTADPRWQPDKPPAPSWRRLAAPFLELVGDGGASSAGHIARLAGSAREMEACARLFGGNGANPILLSGRSATLSRLEENLARQPAAIHFATHVVPSPENPSTSCIALSLRPDGGPDLLGPESVSALRVRSGLVVMSGCSSSTGDVLPGEGLLGLSRGWLRAGAGSVAGTLWPVPDDSGELLLAFYRHLGGAGSIGPSQAPHQALRLAQLEMLPAPDWRSRPAYWAAYLLYSRN